MTALDGAAWLGLRMRLSARSTEFWKYGIGTIGSGFRPFSKVYLKEHSRSSIKHPALCGSQCDIYATRLVVDETNMAMNDETAGGSERRRHKRFECDGQAEVVVFDSNYLFRGAVRDISLTGCYIETRARLNLSRFAEVELRFTANGQHLNTLARVMVIRPGKGAGFEFLPGDPRLDKPFQKLIEKLSTGVLAQT